MPLTWQFDWYLPAYPNGFWIFNPFAWQLLFVFGAWCALGGAARMSRILSSPVTMWICVAYLLFAFFVTLTWHMPQLSFLMPKLARTVDVSDHQDRSGRAALCPFSGAGGAHRALPAQGLAGAEIALAATVDPVRPAFA